MESHNNLRFTIYDLRFTIYDLRFTIYDFFINKRSTFYWIGGLSIKKHEQGNVKTSNETLCLKGHPDGRDVAGNQNIKGDRKPATQIGNFNMRQLFSLLQGKINKRFHKQA